MYECWPERRTSHLCFINADGTGYRQLTYQTIDQWPAWSPDGKRIVFARDEASFQTALFAMNLDGSGLMQLTDKVLYATHPDWSSDGTRIAFTYFKKEDNTQGIAIVNADGGGFRVLTTSGKEPHWSPDGTRIAYTSHGDSLQQTGARAYVINADGTDQTLLIDQYAESPSWSPDGKKIAYYCYQGGLYAMNTDGSSQIRLTNWLFDQIYRPSSPCWSPDGQYIVQEKSVRAAGRVNRVQYTSKLDHTE